MTVRVRLQGERESKGGGIRVRMMVELGVSEV
jgi:hypothetical protein